MKLRLLKYADKLKFFCRNGSIKNVTVEEAIEILVNYKPLSNIKGNDGYWNTTYGSMAEPRAGHTIAYIDDKDAIVISDLSFFTSYVKEKKKAYVKIEDLSNGNYLSTSQYAQKNDRETAIVKRYASNGRIKGVVKTPLGYLFPKDAIYPVKK